MAINGIYLGAVGVGSIFVMSGIRGWGVLRTTQELITGVKPQDIKDRPINPGNVSAGTSPGVGSGTGGTTSSAIANEALKHNGHAYHYGGTPGKDGSRPWDCSSFVNWVIGTKLGGSIPGYPHGSFNGMTHGPPTGSWAVWPGLTRIKRSDVQAGDIAIWAGHMGIAISNSQMISAEDEALGTRVGAFAAGSGDPFIKFGRYRA